MFRFAIRDVLWLTVMAAMAIGWTMEFYRSPVRRQEFRANALQRALEDNGFTIEQKSPFEIRIDSHGYTLEYTMSPLAP